MAHDPHLADSGAAALRPPRENIFARPGATPVFHERAKATTWPQPSRVAWALVASAARLLVAVFLRKPDRRRGRI